MFSVGLALMLYIPCVLAQYMIPSPLPEGPLTYHGPNGEVPIPPLFEAVIRKDAQRVDALLTQGADANEMCPCGTSPLQTAVSQAKDAHITELLLVAGSDYRLGSVRLTQAAQQLLQRVQIMACRASRLCAPLRPRP
jgi:hypothetical protein